MMNRDGRFEKITAQDVRKFVEIVFQHTDDHFYNFCLIGDNVRALMSAPSSTELSLEHVSAFETNLSSGFCACNPLPAEVVARVIASPILTKKIDLPKFQQATHRALLLNPYHPRKKFVLIYGQFNEDLITWAGEEDQRRFPPQIIQQEIGPHLLREYYQRMMELWAVFHLYERFRALSSNSR
jgi:hypothetical protein